MTANDKRICLIRGPLVSRTGTGHHNIVPAIGLAYLAGYLAKFGEETEIVDAIAEGLGKEWPSKRFPGFTCAGLTFENIIERIPRSARVIGFSAMFSGEWPVLRELIFAVRSKFPDALLVAGGEHATALAEYSLRDCPALDAVVRGEGEHAFYELVHAGGKNWKAVNGVAWLGADGGYENNRDQPRIREIDDIPWPLWPVGYLKRFWDRGHSYGPSTSKDMPMMISRGCPYRCTFCSNEAMWTTRYILRDVEDVVREVKTYVSKYAITGVQLFDLTAVMKKNWVIALARRLREEDVNIRWSFPSGTRSEALDEETLTALKRMGCHYLVYAPESGSPRTLARIQKRIDLARMVASMRAALRLGINLRTNLIIGFPDERRGDVYRTLWFGLKMAVVGVRDIPLFIFSPYPGTILFDRCVERGQIALNDAFFLGLTSLNSNFRTIGAPVVNARMARWELSFYRASFMAIYILVSYLAYPGRIVRSFRNIFTTHTTETILEQRLAVLIRRRMAKE